MPAKLQEPSAPSISAGNVVVERRQVSTFVLNRRDHGQISRWFGSDAPRQPDAWYLFGCFAGDRRFKPTPKAVSPRYLMRSRGYADQFFPTLESHSTTCWLS